MRIQIVYVFFCVCLCIGLSWLCAKSLRATDAVSLYISLKGKYWSYGTFQTKCGPFPCQGIRETMKNL